MKKTRIEKKIDQEEKEIREITKTISRLEEKLLEKVPSHFRKRDIINSFFGALIVGLAFVFRGLLFDVGLRLSWAHVTLIVVVALILLTAEIYYISYSRVKERKERPFGQFWAKRVITIYGIALVVSFGLLYLYGINLIVGSLENVIKLTFVMSLPCAVGAAIPSLLKKY